MTLGKRKICKLLGAFSPHGLQEFLANLSLGTKFFWQFYINLLIN